MTDTSVTAENLPANETEAPALTPKPLSAKEEAIDSIRFLAWLAVAVFIFRSFFLSPFNIPSESMQPRLLIGDYLLVNKMAYGYTKHSLPFSAPLIPGRIFAKTPERGDVVVFKAPPTNKDDWIKRVIGVPGDTVQVRDGVVWLNGTALKRQQIADLVIPVTANMVDAAKVQGTHPCYATEFEEINSDGQRQCRYRQFRETLPNGKSYAILDIVDLSVDNTPLYTVPQGKVFLMGDNRDRSADSRVPIMEGGLGGAVPEENLVGKALVSMFSTDGSASWVNPISWFTAARWSRIGEGF